MMRRKVIYTAMGDTLTNPRTGRYSVDEGSHQVRQCFVCDGLMFGKNRRVRGVLWVDLIDVDGDGAVTTTTETVSTVSVTVYGGWRDT
jgi:hypothetical protein